MDLISDIGQIPHLYDPAWGSISVYVVHKDGFQLPKTYNMSKCFDACKIQFLLQKQGKLKLKRDHGLAIHISIKNSIVQCTVAGAKTVSESFKGILLSVFNEAMQGLDCHYFASNKLNESVFNNADPDLLRNSMERYDIEIYDCGSKGKCAVGQQKDVKEFLKDIGINCHLEKVDTQENTNVHAAQTRSEDKQATNNETKSVKTTKETCELFGNAEQRVGVGNTTSHLQRLQLDAEQNDENKTNITSDPATKAEVEQSPNTKKADIDPKTADKAATKEKTVALEGKYRVNPPVTF